MLKIGLIGHSFCGGNFGLGALAFGEVYAIKMACRKANIDEVRITCFETAIKDPYADDECVKQEEYRIKKPWQSIRQFAEMDYIFDMSGGDSFSDIYGNKLYLIQMIIKSCILLSKRPYIVAPQTIGPFKSKWAKWFCNIYVAQARGVFLRDRLSVECLNKKNQKKAVSVTDLGLLMPYEPREKNSVFTVGFNVSGLLYQKQSLASDKCDYKKLCSSVIEFFLSKGCNVLLVPHVVGIDRASIDNDYYICKDLAEKYKLPPVPQFKSPKEAKSFISQCDLFLGSRICRAR